MADTKNLSPNGNAEHLLVVNHLKKYFPIKKALHEKDSVYLKAVDDVSLTLDAGKTVGIVGESGCGKSTLGRTILRLYEPTAGEIIFDGDHIENLKGEALRRKRPEFQMIFQDPMASLNERAKVDYIVSEGLLNFHMYKDEADREAKVQKALREVGLLPEFASRFPHEFSGGQRQRIGIARALAVNPKFIVCDEPVSALDVSIQAQVVNMFEELQDKLGVAYLFIAHDLLVVHHISDRIAVMYLGKMMEIADADELNGNPMHPYTLSLLSAVPIPDPETARHSKRIVLEGDVPSPLKMPTGCPFRTRCKYATEQCAKEMPPLSDRGSGHFVACWNK